MWLYRSLSGSESTSILFKEQWQKEVKKEFLWLSWNTLLASKFTRKLSKGDNFSCFPSMQKINRNKNPFNTTIIHKIRDLRNIKLKTDRLVSKTNTHISLWLSLSLSLSLSSAKDFGASFQLSPLITYKNSYIWRRSFGNPGYHWKLLETKITFFDKYLILFFSGLERWGGVLVV